MERLTTRHMNRDFKIPEKMKKITIILMFAAMLAGCHEDIPYDKPLTLSGEKNLLSASAGRTPVIVYTDGSWTAFLPGDCTWASIDRTTGDGTGQIIFSYEENVSFSRKAIITVTSGTHKKMIAMIQKSSGETEISFVQNEWKVARRSGKAHLPFSNIIPESELGNIRATVSTSDGGAWIGEVSVFTDELMFDIQANNSGKTRTAVVTATYTDVMGNCVTAEATISQTMEDGKVVFGKLTDSENAEVNRKGIAAEAAALTLEFETNLSLFIPQMLQSAGMGTEWYGISYADRHNSELNLTIAQNSSQSSRQGRITLSHTDNEGNTEDFHYILLQKN